MADMDDRDDVERPPWWLSENQQNQDSHSDERRSESGATWMSLLGSLSSLAGEWWSASGANEHGSHGDPAEHPECIVCRASVVLTPRSSEPRTVPAVRWLDVRRL